LPASLDISIRVSPDVLFQEVQGEIVLLHLGNESYFGLNAIGARIWLWLSDGMSPREIQAKILQEYQVESESVTQDLLRLIDDLIRADLVTVAASERVTAE
jgi:hypothetical protein